MIRCASVNKALLKKEFGVAYTEELNLTKLPVQENTGSYMTDDPIANTAKKIVGGRAQLLPFKNFEDERGCLCPIEFPIEGFMPKRAFSVEASNGAARGEHGHRQARQLFFLVSGRVDVDLRYKNFEETVILEPDNRLLLIEPGVWAKQTYQNINSALMVFSDRHYDPDDYLKQVEQT